MESPITGESNESLPSSSELERAFVASIRPRLALRLRIASGLLAAVGLAMLLVFEVPPVEGLAMGLTALAAAIVAVLPAPALERHVLSGAVALSVVGFVGVPFLQAPPESTRAFFVGLLPVFFAAFLPLPSRARLVQHLLFLVGLIAATPRFAWDAAPPIGYLLGLIILLGSSWAIEDFNLQAWWATFVERRRLLAASEQLARQSRQLRLAVDSTRQELENQHAVLVEQERLATLGRLAAGVGHEINNPLAVALANVELARHDDDPELLHDARVALKRIRDIVKDLSRIARPPGDEASVYPANRVIEAALGMARIGLKSRLAVRASNLPDTPVVADQARLTQVLVNLLVNATHATEQRDQARVHVLAEIDEQRVRVHIDDNGPGISIRDRERLFEPFFTTKPSGKGTGLGLPLSQAYMRAMDGDLLLAEERSTLGGARFTLVLERASAGAAVRQPNLDLRTVPPTDEDTPTHAARLPEPSPAPLRATPSPPPPPRVQGQPALSHPDAPIRRSLLVIDDEPTVRRALRRSLRERWEVTEAAGVDDALARIGDSPPDVILCDLVLQETGEDAIDVLERVQDAWPHLLARTVLMTGEPTTGRLMALAHGNAPYLVRKPFSLTTLEALLARAARGDRQPIRLDPSIPPEEPGIEGFPTFTD